MDALGIDKVDLYGSHHPAHRGRDGDRTPRPLPEDDLRRHRDVLARGEAREPGELRAGDRARRVRHAAALGLAFRPRPGWFFPYFKRDAAHARGLDVPSIEALHRTTVEGAGRCAPPPRLSRVVVRHQEPERLPLIKVPTLIMADDTDPR